MAKQPREATVTVKPDIDLTKFREEAAEIIAKLKEERRLTHEAAQELREAAKEAKLARQELIEAKRDALKLDAATLQRELRTLGKREMDRYSSEITKAITDGTQAAYDRFDSITAICLGTDPESVRNGDKSLEELLRAFVHRRGLPYKIVPNDNDEWPEAFRALGISIRVHDSVKPGTALLVSSGTDPDGKVRVSAQAVEGLIPVEAFGHDAIFATPKDVPNEAESDLS